MKRAIELKDRVSVYGVPRRFDLATLLVISLAFAGLFALLHLFGAPSVVTAVVLTFIVVVGLAQAVLFGGRAPRRSSLIAGMLLGPALIGSEAYFRQYTFTVEDVLIASIVYVPFGYMSGAVIGGVFRVSDRLRALIRRG